MLTNLGREQASVAQLGAVYRARWAVEASVARWPAKIKLETCWQIQFRAWKQALNLGKALNRRSGEHHMQTLVLAAMIAHQLGMKIAPRIGGVVGLARLSDKKLYDLLALHLIKSADLAGVTAFNPDPRRFMRDKRARQFPME